MILSLSGISKSYGAERVLQNVAFILNAGEHAGLVGSNGVGKSTLLKIIIGEVEPDRGEVLVGKGIDIGYLPQAITEFGQKTVDDLLYESRGDLRQIESKLRELENQMHCSTGDSLKGVLSEYNDLGELFERRGGYEIDYKIDFVLNGLKLDHIQRDRQVATLSGGEKARVGLAMLLLRDPELLLLDEPTNHLDFFSLEWLEAYLLKYRGTLLAVSHDRQFLNRTVNKILEVSEYSREIKEYPGNFDSFLVSKSKERAKWEEDYKNQQKRIKELQHAMRAKSVIVGHDRAAPDADKIAYKFFGERVQKTVSRNVRSAAEKLLRIEANPIPEPPEQLRISPEFDPQSLEAEVPLHASRVGKSYAKRKILKGITFSLRFGDRVVLTGPNGAGKSTLLKILAGYEVADVGRVIMAPGVKISYLDQEQETLNLEETLIEAYAKDLPGNIDSWAAELFRYGLFLQDDLKKRIGDLSIGQRRKLQIARMIAERANILLLDEPTNYVSFDVLEEFEKALLSFKGCILAVSHDRWFTQRFAHTVWELDMNKFRIYPNGCEGYREAKEKLPSKPEGT